MFPIDFFDTAVAARADRIAVIDSTATLSFRELQLLSARIADALVATHRATEGIRAAIWSPNDYRVLACTLGIMRAGGSVIPVHALNDLATIHKYFDAVKPTCVFFHGDVARQVAELRCQHSSAVHWICLDDGHGGDVSLHDFAALSESTHDDGNPPVYGVVAPVYLWSTSGTTGEPKVVVDEIDTFNATFSVMRQVLDVAPAPVCLVVAPLSHAAGVHALMMLSLGATVILRSTLDGEAILAAIESHNVTHMWLTPTALYLLVEAAQQVDHDYSSLRSIMLGASALAPARLREAVATFGPCISYTYSQIETGFVTVLHPQVIARSLAGEHPERLRSSGTHVGIARAAIMGADGQLLECHDEGEIVVRGPSVKQYLRPHTTVGRQLGWHRTGDLGYLDADGYLYVTDRIKDNVITAGFKVASVDVERVVMEHPAVRECAVVGIPDAIRGETLAAVVTIASGQTVTSAELATFCKRRIGALKTPRVFEQWQEIPKSAVGKIDKRVIRQRLADLRR